MSIIPTGSILTITYGSYDQAQSNGPHLVARDLDQTAAGLAFRQEWAKQGNKTPPGHLDFVIWLQQSGYLEAVEAAFDWDIGDDVLEVALPAAWVSDGLSRDGSQRWALRSAARLHAVVRRKKAPNNTYGWRVEFMDGRGCWQETPEAARAYAESHLQLDRKPS